ncbi:MAG: C13 family peptidase [Porticoccaceae bacterium]
MKKPTKKMKTTIISVAFFTLGILLASLFLKHYQIIDHHIQRIPTLSFADGSTYAGEVNESGLIHGSGHLRWPGGQYYKGEFKDGMMHGQGKLMVPDNVTIDGNFSEGLAHGKAVIRYDEGQDYEGEVAQGRITGKGKWLVPDEHQYFGDVKDGHFHGLGEITYENGNKYSGHFEHGEMHGKGRYETKEGDIYSGTFINDSFSGTGTLKRKNINEKGQFKDWVLHGQGSRTDADGNQWQGVFESGDLTGAGVYTRANGEHYAGEFLHGMYHGKGWLTAETGDIYKGEFNYGAKHGRGEMTLKKAVDNVTYYTGEWRHGDIIEGDENFNIYSASEISEFSLYNQASMLNKALDDIAPENPGKIDLFVMGVAGHGSEEVFRREVNYVENKMHELYGVEKNSLYLSNSRKSIDDRPLATITSIENGLMAIAKKMDKEQDILFLFLTSHGSKDFKLSLNQKGLSLGSLDSNKLASTLKETKIKHKVIVISACYSGGFIEELKDDHTMIITAASAKKTSFGCADNNQFTYFGEAYFKESMDTSTSFHGAFENAKNLIAEWEKEQDIKPSEPQISSTPQIEEHLEKWRKQF